MGELKKKFNDAVRQPFTQFNDQFDHHAKLINDQIHEKGFCTKLQLEYLILYNKRCEEDK